MTTKQIEWAWKKRKEGHPIFQIAKALHVSEKTLTKHLVSMFGTSKPKEIIDLYYE